SAPEPAAGNGQPGWLAGDAVAVVAPPGGNNFPRATCRPPSCPELAADFRRGPNRPAATLPARPERASHRRGQAGQLNVRRVVSAEGPMASQPPPRFLPVDG